MLTIKKFMLLVACTIVLTTICYANWGTTKYGGNEYGTGRWGTSVSTPSEAGFLLLESSGDKLLLESGVTDALLLEG